MVDLRLTMFLVGSSLFAKLSWLEPRKKGIVPGLTWMRRILPKMRWVW